MTKKSYITTCKDRPSKDVDNSQLKIKNNLRQTTCSIINESVTSIFNKLQTARHADSTWIPKIILNIPTPLCVSSLLPPSTTPINTTDIVPFLQVPSLQLGIVLRHQLNYPDNCTFCLEGYKGMNDSKRLVTNIITAALKNGTSLRIDTNDHYMARPNQ